MENYSINTQKNKNHYDQVYSDVDINAILKKINNLDDFLSDATRTDTSWVGLYHGNFKSKLKGKRILELGCGDCTNLAIMAALGAEVYGNDISQKSGLIIEKLNANFKFQYPIQFVEGDFLESNLNENQFDFVIGKAFIHHLTNIQEIKRKFEIWKKNDPHPIRDNSSGHYRSVGYKFFKEVKIVPIGTIERFCKFIPSKWNRPIRRLSYKIEKFIPYSINLYLTRSHLIEYKYPKKVH